jgi:glycine hydroxymethyltransferase
MNNMKDFFSASLMQSDSDLFTAIDHELTRQRDGIELIASENIVSRAVLEAQGSVLTNKYAEGYPGRRYYGGCEHVDVVEQLAIDRAKKLFNCEWVNVQPHSGAQANQGVFLALLKPGDTILGMSLAAGGHLTHGSAPNLSGKWFNAVQYGVRPDNGLIDYDELQRMADEHKPKMIIAGGSAYTRIIDFKRFREVADSCGAYLMVDMAHISGLVAAGAHPSPIEHAHVVTSTTHKTLRCSRGGIILSNDLDLGKKINSAMFPGLQGGPLMHAIAGKAAGFGEALKPEFKTYINQVVENAKVLSDTLIECGFDMVSGGTDNHIVLVDLRPKKLTGDISEVALERAEITCNKNGVPFDPEKPMVTSGIRLGTPAATTRGFGVDEFRQVGHLIGEVLDGLASNRNDNSADRKAHV